MPGARKSNEFYQELIRSWSCKLTSTIRRLKKTIRGRRLWWPHLINLNSDWGLKRLLNRLNKIKKGAQDAYTAEDDFWKIFTYLGEKSKLSRCI